jgi:hypothetical protein
MVAEPAGQILDGDLRHQVQVEFGPDSGQRSGKYLSAVIRRMVHQVVSSVDTANRASKGDSWRDRWANRRRTTHACSLKLSRAAMTASSKLGTTTIS